MKKESFFTLAIIVLGIWMTVRALFWGSSSNKNPDITEPTGTWFTKNLLNSGDIKNEQPVDITKPTEANNENTEIRVMMPKYFYTSWRRKFAEDLYSDQKVYMNFSFVDDLNSYRDTLLNKDFSDADLFLFPYDRYDSVTTRSFTFQQDISPEFDPLISPLVKESPTSFMPFAVDPMIMYVLTWDSIQSTFFDIYDYVCERKSKKPWSFPLFYWITDEDYNQEWFQREYQDIVRYALLHYFKTYNDSNSLSQRTSNNIFESYNIQDLDSVSNALTTNECKYFPSICFQIYNFVWIRFWFLSDADIVKQYFWNKKQDFYNISKMVLPFHTVESPVRVRWRSMPNSLKNTDTINWVYAFLIKYMNDHNNYDLRSSSLSVFSNEWDELRYNKYIWARWYILKTWWNYIEYLRKTKLFWQLISYQITAEDYIRRS